MDELLRPLVRFWDWIDGVGGYPGKLLLICGLIMLIIAGLTWYGNKR